MPVRIVLALAILVAIALIGLSLPWITPGPASAGELPGDANCDGTANSIDAALVLQRDAGLIDLLACEQNADANGDSAVNSIDAALILQYDAGLIDSLGPPPATPTATPTSTPLPPSAPTSTASPTPTTTPPADTENVGIVVIEDDIVLDGRHFGAQNDVGVILSHMRPSDQTAWFSFAQELADNGYAALTFNFRGYGDSEGDRDFDKLDEDLSAALRYMRDRGKRQIFLVGASMGGTTSLVVAAQEDVAGVVAVSAPAQFEGQDALSAIPNVTAPTLLIASEDDMAAVVSLAELVEVAGEPTEVETYPGTAHGTDLLQSEHAAAFRQRILQFLREHGAAPTVTLTPAATTEAQEVAVSLVQFDVVPDPTSVVDGPVTFQVSNNGTIAHNFRVIRTDLDPAALPLDDSTFRVDENQLDVVARSENLGAGETEAVTADLGPGSYVLICNVPTHYQAGMFTGFLVATPIVIA